MENPEIDDLDLEQVEDVLKV